MAEALLEAQIAGDAGDVPVGAVIVVDGAIVGRGSNRRERDGDSTAHAEVVAIRDASTRLGRWNLSGATIYVTIEPCVMCAGAIWLARLARVVYGACEPKTGAVHTRHELLSDGRLDRTVPAVGGCRACEAAALLRRFFEVERRDARAAESGGLENR